MTKDREIEERLKKCIKQVKDIDIQEESYNLPLTGREFQFTPIELTYLLLEICKEFGIGFSAEDVEDYGFNSVDKILNLIEHKVSGNC